jgi:hypothetical protein
MRKFHTILVLTHPVSLVFLLVGFALFVITMIALVGLGLVMWLRDDFRRGLARRAAPPVPSEPPFFSEVCGWITSEDLHPPPRIYQDVEREHAELFAAPETVRGLHSPRLARLEAPCRFSP